MMKVTLNTAKLNSVQLNTTVLNTVGALSRTKGEAPPEPDITDALLMEDGSLFLMEDGDYFKLEIEEV